MIDIEDSVIINQPVGKVPPDGRTQAEWTAYLEADKHAKGQDTVSKYVSTAFRESIAGENKAAAKFAKVPGGRKKSCTQMQKTRVHQPKVQQISRKGSH